MNSAVRIPLVWLVIFLGLNAFALTSQGATVSETASEISRDVSRAAQETLEAVKRNDPRRLSLGEIVAWLIIGCTVGALAGRITSSPGARLGRILLGLAGAFVGAILIDVLKIDFQWGEVVLRYEEATAALAVSLAAVYGGRFIAARFKRSRSARSSGESGSSRKN